MHKITRTYALRPDLTPEAQHQYISDNLSLLAGTIFNKTRFCRIDYIQLRTKIISN